MKSITIVADDKVGLLADISYILAKESINIESLNVDVISDKAVIILNVKEGDKARTALEASGYNVTEENMVIVKLDDKPGELSRITKMLASEGVNIDNVLILTRDGKNTVLSLAVDNTKKASEILKDCLITDI
jgi:hypothetical protein